MFQLVEQHYLRHLCLEDIGIIESKSTQDIIDKNKVTKQRQAQRSNHMNDYLEITSILMGSLT